VNKPTELLPCPFCGSTEIEQEETITDAAVICRNCGSRTGFVFLGASDASNAFKMREQRDLWNTRALTTYMTGD
jgi:Lar family restriction alleviation protein